MATVSFNYVSGTTREAVATVHHELDFYNLKNKAEGARRYGMSYTIVKYSNPEGQVAFVGEFQTTLNGRAYQSSKRSNWFATPDEAQTALVKTGEGAQKRYAKLAKDPAKSGVEHRPS